MMVTRSPVFSKYRRIKWRQTPSSNYFATAATIYGWPRKPVSPALTAAGAFTGSSLNDSITDFSCTNILETKTIGVILFTNLGQYSQNPASKKWELLNWIPAKFRFEKIQEVSRFSDDKIIYSLDSLVAIVDYASRKIIYEDIFIAALSSCRINNQQIAVGLQTGQVKVVDINTNKKIVREYQLTGKLNGITVNTALNHLQLAPNGEILVATVAAGLVRIDSAGNKSNYIHDPLSEASISAKNTFKVLTEPNGNVFVATGIGGY